MVFNIQFFRKGHSTEKNKAGMVIWHKTVLFFILKKFLNLH